MKKVVVTIFALAILCAQLVRASTDWPYLKLTRVGSGEGFFTGLTDAGDGSGRLYAVDRPGKIWIIQSNEFLNSPLLDITSKVASLGEEGLLSAAFPPGSGPKTNFYVCYTRKPDNVVVVSRFRIGADTNHVDPQTEEVILTIPTLHDEHYGGQLAFGPDGYLYISRGDSDADAAAVQSGSNYFGKVLRIDVQSVSSGYAIPADNPFVSNTNFLPEIWAMGLRNPWRFSFDRLTGDLYIADVGAVSREEIDFQPAGVGGKNYGWPVKEGSLDLSPVAGVNPALLTSPIFEYDHHGGLACIIGGFVSRGSSARMNGIYLYGDYVIGGVYGLKQSGTNWEQHFFMTSPGSDTFSFGQDQSGQIYLLGSKIYRIDDTGEPYPPTFNPPPELGTNTGMTTISTITSNAQIHWTTNGLDPAESDPTVPSGGSLPIEFGVTLKARAFRADLLPSEVASATYTNYVVARPELNLPSGPVTNGFPLAISTATPAAVIHYTTDGSDPDTNSPVYSGPLPFTGFKLTLKAQGFRDGYTPSEVTQGDFGLIAYEDADVTTLAGNGVQGFADGIGTNAQFNLISAVRLDSQGNLIVGEMAGAIRKVSPSGQVTTLLDYNTLTNSGPLMMDQIGIDLVDLCVASNGAIYFTPNFDSRIWRFNPPNSLAPFAGAGAPDPLLGPQDGPPGTGTFYYPTVMALDNQGNIFVADDSNALIRKVAPDGTISTFVHQSFAANYNWTGLAFGPAGSLFGISGGSGDNEIFQVNSAGQVQHFAGNKALGWDGPADQASLNFGNYVTSAAMDPAGNLYTIQFGGPGGTPAWIRKVHPDGSMTTLAGKWDSSDTVSYRDGTSDRAAFSDPFSLCVDTNGVVYVADSYVIRKITPVSSLQITATLRPADKSLLLSWPSAVGRSYQVQSSANLRIWNPLADWAEGTGQLLTFTNQLEPGQSTSQFFRVQVRHD
jgi:glucose/arabinose dehydrogenase